jgi:starch synthase (maltosyl-transferring)
MRLVPSGRAANHDRAVTANASIRSVGDLSRHRIYIEDVYPLVDGGRFPVKRTIGEEVEVWADIFRDGHVVLAAELLWRREGAEKWSRVPMALPDNDRWRGSFTPHKSGRYVYAIEAWTDVFATWRRDFLTKCAAGMDIRLEVEEGRNLLADLRLKSIEQAQLIRDICSRADLAENPAPLLSDELAAAARKAQQSDITRSANFPLLGDRPIARAGAWYEMMPRSQSSVPGKHGTFDDCINRLPDIAALGFDVLYLTPIHPIGRVNRKGRNNALRCEARDPGSPYAIGSAEGGHDAVHPELGTLEDFRRWCEPARIWDWRWRSTLPSSARPTTRGLCSILSGSNAGPTAPYNTRKTRRKNTRISSIQTCTGPTTKGFGKHCATWCCSGWPKACVFSESTTRTPSRFRSGNG